MMIAPSPPRTGIRTSMWLRLLAAAATAALAHGATAQETDLPHPSPVSLLTLLNRLAMVEALPDAATTVDATEALLTGSAALAKDVDIRFASIHKDAGAEPETLLGPKATQRLTTLGDEAATRQRELLSTFHARIAAALPPEKAPLVEACRLLACLDAARDRWIGGVYQFGRRMAPDDISGSLLRVGPGERESTEAATRRLLLAATGAQARIDAFDQAQRLEAARALARAELVQREGVEGRTLTDLLDHVVRAGTGSDAPEEQRMLEDVLRKSPMTTPGNDAWNLLVRAQLASYREIEPLLTDADGAALAARWKTRLRGDRSETRGPPGVPFSGDSRVCAQIFLATAALSEADREKARQICRRWLKEERAAVDRAFESLLADTTAPESGGSRSRVAKAAWAELSALPGLDWIMRPATDAASIPPLQPLSAEDAAEFGNQVADLAADLAEAPTRKARNYGAPVAPSREDMARVMALLHPSQEDAALVAALLGDYRERWERELGPRCAEVTPPPFAGGAPMPLPADEAARLDRERRLRRAELWRIAGDFDASLLDGLRASLGDRLTPGSIELLKATLAGRRLAVEVQDPIEPARPLVVVNAPGVLADACLTPEGMGQALASASPQLAQWNQALVAMFDAVDAARKAGPGERAALERVAAAADALERLGEELFAAVSASLAARPSDLLRWTLVSTAEDRSGKRVDPRPLLRALSVSVACVPPEARPAYMAALEPALQAACGQLLASLEAPVFQTQTSTRQRQGGEPRSRPSRREAVIGPAKSLLVLTGVRACLLLPEECREGFQDPSTQALLRASRMAR